MTRNRLAYPAANRLTSAQGPWGSESFSYDAVGNRLNDNTASGSSTTANLASYDTLSNHLLSLTQNSASFRTYTYDGAGNVANDNRPGEAYVFTYNNRGRPASVSRNAAAYATYGYNALEELTTRSTSATGGPAGTVAYIYDTQGHLIAEADAASGAISREYIWMPANDNTPVDLPLAVIDGVGTATPVLVMVHTDHLGRPIRMTDATKATVFTAIYKPYGEVYSTSASVAQNLRFPGQYFQIETGFAYNWHRQYDPFTGRYTQPDPLGLRAGMNRYSYVRGNPLRVGDRTGLAEPTVIGGPGFPPPNSMPGGPWNWSPDSGNSRGGTWQDPAGKSTTWDPEGQHWDTDMGDGTRQRYNRWGAPIDPGEAHGPYDGPFRLPLFPPRAPLGPLIIIPSPVLREFMCTVNPSSPGCQICMN